VFNRRLPHVLFAILLALGVRELLGSPVRGPVLLPLAIAVLVMLVLSGAIQLAAGAAARFRFLAWQLPFVWFELRDGRLRLHPGVGPWAFGSPFLIPRHPGQVRRFPVVVAVGAAACLACGIGLGLVRGPVGWLDDPGLAARMLDVTWQYLVACGIFYLLPLRFRFSALPGWWLFSALVHPRRVARLTAGLVLGRQAQLARPREWEHGAEWAALATSIPDGSRVDLLYHNLAGALADDTGRHEEAARLLDHILAHLDALPVRLRPAFLGEAAYRAALVDGDLARAEELLAGTIDAVPAAQSDVLRGRAALALAGGHPAEALRLLDGWEAKLPATAPLAFRVCASEEVAAMREAATTRLEADRLSR
jgi:hypothetical protein